MRGVAVYWSTHCGHSSKDFACSWSDWEELVFRCIFSKNLLYLAQVCVCEYYYYGVIDGFDLDVGGLLGPSQTTKRKFDLDLV